MTYQVSFKKTFTTGHLKNITVDGGWNCPDYVHLLKDLRKLRSFEARRAIKQDMFTKDEYFIHHVKQTVSK